MPKYLFQGSYTAEGVRGLAKEGGSSRRDHFAQNVGNLEGKGRYKNGRPDHVEGDPRPLGSLGFHAANRAPLAIDAHTRREWGDDPKLELRSHRKGA